MKEKLKYLLLILVPVSLGLLLHWFGWKFVSLPEIAVNDPGGNYLNPPQFITETFGARVAAIFPPLVLSVCTILGITANILFLYTKRSIKKLTKRAFGPLLISPIILFATYATAMDHPDGFVACLMAFQNGFFWQAIFSSRELKD
jgi:hypothetical protein